MPSVWTLPLALATLLLNGTNIPAFALDGGRELEMSFTDAVRSDHEAVIEEWLRLDLRDRQLSVLRNTFPNWNIGYEFAPSGRCVWTATAPWRLTLEMVTAGILRTVQRGDPIDLMAALTYQVVLIGQVSRPHH